MWNMSLQVTQQSSKLVQRVLIFPTMNGMLVSNIDPKDCSADKGCVSYSLSIQSYLETDQVQCSQGGVSAQQKGMPSPLFHNFLMMHFTIAMGVASLDGTFIHWNAEFERLSQTLKAEIVKT
jgi:hypothetical protein